MTIKFFVYSTITGSIDLLSESLPDDLNFETSGNVVTDNGSMTGVKWAATAWVYCKAGVELEPEPGKYIYNPATKEITEDPNFI